MQVQQFQLQKQASLNQINVVVPLNLSQIYTFEGSGAFTGPTDGAVGEGGEGTGGAHLGLPDETVALVAGATGAPIQEGLAEGGGGLGEPPFIATFNIYPHYISSHIYPLICTLNVYFTPPITFGWCD